MAGGRRRRWRCRSTRARRRRRAWWRRRRWKWGRGVRESCADQQACRAASGTRVNVTETFLILLAAGVMLAAAVSDAKEVTLQWLRLGGILALALGALGLFFFLRRE